jgi:flagellar hook-length control protein FliK
MASEVVSPACISPPRASVVKNPARVKDEPDSISSFEKMMKDKEKEQCETETARAVQGGLVQSKHPAAEPERKPEADTAEKKNSTVKADKAAEKVAQAPSGADPLEAQVSQPAVTLDNGTQAQAYAAAIPAVQTVNQPAVTESAQAAVAPLPAAVPVQAQNVISGTVSDEGKASETTGLESQASVKQGVPAETQPEETKNPLSDLVTVPMADNTQEKKAPASAPATAFTQALEAVDGKNESAQAAAAGFISPAPATQQAVSKSTEAVSAVKVKTDVEKEVNVQVQTNPAVDKSLAQVQTAQQMKAPIELQNAVRETSTKAETQAADMSQQIARNIETTMQQGRNYLRMQLNPQELGAIDIRLHNTAHGVNVTVIAEQASTGQMLETHLNQLRQTLADAGVQLGNLNINQHTSGQAGKGFEQNTQSAYSHLPAERQQGHVHPEIIGQGTSSLPVSTVAQSVDYRI